MTVQALPFLQQSAPGLHQREPSLWIAFLPLRPGPEPGTLQPQPEWRRSLPRDSTDSLQLRIEPGPMTVQALPLLQQSASGLHQREPSLWIASLPLQPGPEPETLQPQPERLLFLPRGSTAWPQHRIEAGPMSVQALPLWSQSATALHQHEPFLEKATLRFQPEP